MPTPPPPSPEFIARQVRWAMGRGLPPQAAEDVVFEAWERAVSGFDPSRGTFEAYMQVIVRSRCAGWWRHQGRWVGDDGLELVTGAGTADPERAAHHRAILLDALTDEERAVFAAWALQKHVGKGQLTSGEVGRSIGLEPRAFDNAKRRLKDRLHRLLERFGWSTAELWDGGDDGERVG